MVPFDRLFIDIASWPRNLARLSCHAYGYMAMLLRSGSQLWRVRVGTLDWQYVHSNPSSDHGYARPRSPSETVDGRRVS